MIPNGVSPSLPWRDSVFLSPTEHPSLRCLRSCSTIDGNFETQRIFQVASQAVSEAEEPSVPGDTLFGWHLERADRTREDEVNEDARPGRRAITSCVAAERLVQQYV